MSDSIGIENPIAVSLVAYDGYDLATALESIGALGIEVIELAQIAGNSETFSERNLDKSFAKQARDLLARYDLSCRCLSAHIDLSSTGAITAMERRLVYASTVGASYIATKSAPVDGRTQLVDNLHQIAEMATDFGITILLENPSAGSGDVVDDGASGAAFIAEMGLHNVRFNYDFGNLMSRHRGQLQPEIDCLPALDYCDHLHVKDVRRTDEGWIHTSIGQGDIDYTKIFDSVRRMKTEPFVTIEVPMRMIRTVDGTPYPPLPPLPIAEIEQIVMDSMAFVVEKLRQ